MTSSVKLSITITDTNMGLFRKKKVTVIEETVSSETQVTDEKK